MRTMIFGRKTTRQRLLKRKIEVDPQKKKKKERLRFEIIRRMRIEINT